MSSSPVLQRWASDWMNLVADGQELLISVLERSGKGLHQAVWTRSPYLVWSSHSALYAEILLSRLRIEIENGASKRKLLRLVEDYHDRIATDAPAVDGFLLHGRRVPYRYLRMAERKEISSEER
ncbi:MAG: hypothetical protein WA628_10110 [Terriglobales bacterium]